MFETPLIEPKIPTPCSNLTNEFADLPRIQYQSKNSKYMMSYRQATYFGENVVVIYLQDRTRNNIPLLCECFVLDLLMNIKKPLYIISGI